MKVVELRSPLVRRVIETINGGKLEEFMRLFAPDAVVVDGATYAGTTAIRAWARRETFGVHMHVEVLRETDADGNTLDVHVGSRGGYTGPGTFAFAFRDGLIERLDIVS